MVVQDVTKFMDIDGCVYAVEGANYQWCSDGVECWWGGLCVVKRRGQSTGVVMPFGARTVGTGM